MKEATQTQLNEALERQKQAASRVVAGQQPDAEDMETLRQIGMLRRRLVDLGSTDSQLTEWDENREKSQSLALIALCEMLGFFGVLLVGFAYLWRRGDLEWVRSTAAEKQTPAQGVAKTESKAATMAGSK
ncbi:MAG: hypothetical protein EBV06_02850 [Planctomycetia bacterium]|nr:hypothetical protein [Planctomycetia bacterium]